MTQRQIDDAALRPPHAEAGTGLAARRWAALAVRARLATTEHRLVLVALALVAIPIVDDNFVHTEPGTSAGDHLASGLVPVAVLAAVGAFYGRARAGLRGAASIVLAAIAVGIGVPGAHYLREGHAAEDHYTALLGFVAAAILLAVGPVVLWRNRRTGGTSRGRYLLRASSVATAVVATPLAFLFVVFPVAFSYGYVHIGSPTPIPELGIGQEAVSITTSDGIELEAAYVPSRNRAAVIVYPGATRTAHVRMLARHGYGVLLVSPRGQGRSGGDNVRWAGARDVIAAAEYLRARPDLDARRVGAIGFSVGGEILLEAAAQSDAVRAVVTEGAGERVGEADVSGPAKLLVGPSMALTTAVTTVLSNHGPPPAIVDRIGRIAPRPVFLVYADPGMGGEAARQPRYFAAAGEPKAIWKVPGAGHTAGLETRPVEYERRVVAFLDAALGVVER